MRNCAAEPGRRGKGSKHCLRCKVPEMEGNPTRGNPHEGQIRPRTNREGLSPFYPSTRAANMSTPGIASAEALKFCIAAETFPKCELEMSMRSI